MSSVSLAAHIDNRIRPFILATSLLLAILVGATAAIIAVRVNIKSTEKTLRSMAPHLASLAGIQDRSEIERAIVALARVNQGDAWVVQKGIVLATSSNPSEIDYPFSQKSETIKIFGSDVNFQGITTRADLIDSDDSQGKSEIILTVPMSPLFQTAGLVGLGLFLLCLAVGKALSSFIQRIVRNATLSVTNLDMAIRSLNELTAKRTMPQSTGIEEIDRIQNAISETDFALRNARDMLAESRAKELSGEAYMQLIHDLHTPISALRQKAEILNLPNIEAAVKDRAMKRMAGLAEQILTQIESAKNNLEFDASILKELDIVESIAEATEQALATLPKDKPLHISNKIPKLKILIPHDPGLIQRAVRNLIGNALTACRSIVEIEVEQKQSHIHIRVSDDGSGMSPEDVSLHLQGRGSSSNAQRKSFGLASVNHIVRSHGGRVVFSRSSFGGACFELRIGV